MINSHLFYAVYLIFIYNKKFPWKACTKRFLNSYSTVLGF